MFNRKNRKKKVIIEEEWHPELFYIINMSSYPDYVAYKELDYKET